MPRLTFHKFIHRGDIDRDYIGWIGDHIQRGMVDFVLTLKGVGYVPQSEITVRFDYVMAITNGIYAAEGEFSWDEWNQLRVTYTADMEKVRTEGDGDH